MKQKVLKRDLFFITDRIKKLHKNYYICYNRTTKNYEVHFKKQKGGTFCFSAGKTLNVIAIKNAYITQVKNAKKLFLELDKNNKKIDEERQRKIIERNMSDFSILIDYASRKAGDVDFKNFQNFLRI